AEARKGHPAARRAASAERRATSRPARDVGGPELLVGRNPVAEALRARVPATALYLAQGLETDERITESVRIAGNRGIALQVPPFAYQALPDVLNIALESGSPPLLVALDGVTDPRNLGAVIRSALAFGAHGVVIPERRSAGVTATAWRTSAGAAARLPVAQVTNLVRALKECRDAGLFVIGLDADGTTRLDELEMATEPLAVVVGSEGRGLSRLVGENCDLTVSIPMAPAAESLNASVAAAVTLAEVARRRRA
ncbi:MAG TPA: 23S rRNA (guanosine(2251)-2'-O)-methyltransferase RlmB, partial [Jatrophihabitans sp.]|nr:23S rRNA (guanosine(2251)-2'-O)-methyltransferase RlmB [Jatrophihabitans sp.]